MLKRAATTDVCIVPVSAFKSSLHSISCSPYITTSVVTRVQHYDSTQSFSNPKHEDGRLLDVAQCSLVGTDRLLKVLVSSVIRVTIDAVSTSEASISVYQTALRNNPEAGHLHVRLRDNLKSHS
jgi:hypothetical protein